MQRITIWTALAALLLTPVVAAQTAQDLWPVASGNEWTYVTEGRIGAGQKFDVKVTRRSGGWAFLDGIDSWQGTGWGDRYWWMSAASGRIWTWNETAGTYSQAFDLGAAQGSTFKSTFLDGATCENGATWTVTGRGVEVQTPVGTFDDCVVITKRNSVCADAGISHMAFAPRVGLVEYSWTTIAGPVKATLIHALVDGVEYTKKEPNPFGKGIATCLETDKVAYGASDTIRVRLTVRNDSTETVQGSHHNGQRYDFVIRDGSGKEVRRWSADKFFTQAFINVAVGPGDALEIVESMELVDAAGKALPAGDYTIEGSTTGIAARATTPFSIGQGVVR